MPPAFKVVIPARYASTRLPGKPLLDIAGKPMVVRVAEQAAASGAEEALVATDHPLIAEAVLQHGFEVIMTRADHVSGTDRLAEVASQRGWRADEIIVNVQGDEPLIAPALIRSVAENLVHHAEAAVATACHPINQQAEIANPNIVKVVSDKFGYALYFSRAPIPYRRDASSTALDSLASIQAYRHIGIYAYRAHFLHIYSQLPPAQIEQYESLEQLRVLWHGHRISVAVSEDAPAAGVDTFDDLERVRRLWGKRELCVNAK